MNETEAKRQAGHTDPKERSQTEKHEQDQHEKAVEDTFPASDPPATSQPGHGFTASEKLPDPVKHKA